MPTLTAIDVLGIQRYVFASNRLRDAVAASWLVQWATDPGGALAPVPQGDILGAGGGSAILRFADRAGALAFAARYTRRVYEEAPGLDVAIAHRDYGPGELAAALARLQTDLARAKLARMPSAPQLGLSVTAACRVTGLPATDFDPLDSTVPLSRVVLRWRDRDVRDRALERWQEFLGGHGQLAFPPEIDKMGRTYGETSLLGVVHVDGNGVGTRIAEWLQTCTGQDDATVLAQFRGWSTALVAAGRDALSAVVRRTIGAVSDRQVHGAVPELDFDLCATDDRVLLPLRPLLLGGDDLTFLCDGRVALNLAEAALDAFEREVPHLGKVTACAGVALVPAHAPFDRAYDLAEALCASAKRRRQQVGDGGSWIDWHIGTPRPGETVDGLRRRAYTHRTAHGVLTLTCRPYRLGAADEVETWRWLSRTVLGTGPCGLRGERWREHRNKAKDLAWLVREGPEGIRRERERWTVAGRLALPDPLEADDGFLDGTRTPLLDAVELMDIHLPLSEEASTCVADPSA